MDPRPLDLALVYRRTGARPVMPKTVARLAQSMKIIGLKMPIEVRSCERVKNGAPIAAFEIITGQHRFEAARSLGWSTIDAFVSEETPQRQRLWELDENLQRDQGTEAQRAGWHRDREAILVDMGLVNAKPGPAKKDTDKLSATSYAKQAGASLGVDERTVRRDLARGKRIAPAVLAEISGTSLDKGVVLDRVAKVAPAEQAAFVADLKAQAAAPKIAKPALRDEQVIEAQLAALMNAWNKAAPDARQRFLAKIGVAP